MHEDYGSLPYVKCYPGLLNQVFMNLVVNAIRSIRDKGDVYIRTWSDDKNVYASIRDNGVGISKKKLASLFETDIRRQYLTTGGRPRWFTISRDWRNTGQNVMSLWPYPTTVLRCRFGYFRHPRDIRTWDYQIGQVATTASSTAVTGTDTVWASRHAGCLLRTYSDRINSPTSMDGRFPPVDEAVVQSVTSATALVTATALTATQSDVSYTLSDIIDCDNTAMYEAVAYCARNELAKLRRVDPKLQALYQIDYNNALYSAKAQANPSDSVRIAGSFGRSNIGFPGLWSSYYVLS